ncbi:MAG: helix-turn-helix domain-containing protein [Actinomycetota bacterium]|nr:helix-turn-helix domain-containing protein [Actinomycetota bacterium]
MPVFLTVEEAARILRICRTAAYQQAHRWLDTDGREGLPVRKLGSSLRVPTAEFAERFGVRVADIAAALTTDARKVGSQDVSRSLQRSGRSRAKAGSTQAGLPFGG